MLLNLIKNSILVFLLVILAYMQGNLWKKQLITSKYRKSEKYYMHRFHNPKLMQIYVQGALRKKQLIASFVKHFTENH